MSDGVVQFEVTIKVAGPTEQHVTDYCIMHLRDRGYSVRDPSERWETPKQFCARLKIHHETLNRAVAQPDCPAANLHRGQSGRLLKLQSNDLFERFVTRNVQPK